MCEPIGSRIFVVSTHRLLATNLLSRCFFNSVFCVFTIHLATSLFCSLLCFSWLRVLSPHPFPRPLFPLLFFLLLHHYPLLLLPLFLSLLLLLVRLLVSAQVLQPKIFVHRFNRILQSPRRKLNGIEKRQQKQKGKGSWLLIVAKTQQLQVRSKR